MSEALATAVISSPIHGSGTRVDPIRPQVTDDYPIINWSRVGDEHPTEAIACLVRIECEAETLDAIKVDSRYEVLESAG